VLFSVSFTSVFQRFKEKTLCGKWLSKKLGKIKITPEISGVIVLHEAPRPGLEPGT
jgi:hypothetical protein